MTMILRRRTTVSASYLQRSLKRLYSTSSEASKQSPPHANPPKSHFNVSKIIENAAMHEENCIQRNLREEAKIPGKIAVLHKENLGLAKSISDIKSERSQIEKLIKANYKDEGAMAQAQALKVQLRPMEERATEIKREINELAAQLPNTTHQDSPRGAMGEVLRSVGVAPVGKTKSHLEIGEELELLDFHSPRHTSGWGWYFLTNEAVLLEQALVQFALRKAHERGWKMVAAPSVVYSHISKACGFRPRDQNGEMQVYHLADTERSLESTQGSRTELCLAGTAEIPLAAMMTNSITGAERVPLKTVGVSRCFRAEAGARGANTKGLFRVKEFTKVELFAWCEPDAQASARIFDEMIEIQEDVLSSLGLAYKVVNMPTEDMGATAHRKVDIEAFIPSRALIKDEVGFGEVTSTSECTDYQSRRLDAKLKRPDGKEDFLWSLNGTALAVPRIIQAILECNWDEASQSVVIPEGLRGFMGGINILGKKQS